MNLETLRVVVPHDGRFPVLNLAMLVGSPSEASRWKAGLKRAAEHVNAAAARVHVNPWERKILSVVAGLRKRELDQPSTRKRAKAGKFPTPTWGPAIKRAWKQLYANLRYHLASPWRKWARTAAKNLNRRGEGRYAKREN